MSSVRFDPQPQRPEKKKKSLGEGADESRMARISFKNYLRELEEDDEEDDYLEEEEQKLPDSEDAVGEICEAFFEENPDLSEDARQKMSEVTGRGFLHGLHDEEGDDEDNDPIHEAVCFLLDELEIWLQNKGYNAGDISEWLDGPIGDMVYDKFYNGLT